MSIEKRVEHVVEWLKEQVKGSGTEGILVGLSGGIDSAVVAALIKKAFPENSLGIILPCKSNEKDKLDAVELAEAVNIDYIEIELTNEHNSLYKSVNEALGKRAQKRRLTDANLRARLRMSALYAVGNDLGYLVSGTDNAAELLTGYFTKYGDGGVDILPLAHLTKREVFQWAEYLGVPKSILDRKPSAGLWEGQTDEDEMGVTYDAIDDYIENKSVSKEDEETIKRMNRVTEHKRVMPPMPPAFK